MRDPVDTARTGHDRPGEDPDPCALAFLVPARRALRPGVDHRLHAHARAVQVEGGVVGAVVRGEDDGLATGQHAVAVQERPGGAGEHDARAVVVGEDDRSLVCARRKDDGAGPETPHPLPGQVLGRGRSEVVGAPLEREDETVVVAAESGGALQVQDLRVAGEFGDRGGDPLQRRSVVEPVGARQQRAAGLGLLVDERDAGPGPGGGECGGQPRGSGPHDQHVDVVVDGVVAGGVGNLGESTLPWQAVGDQPVVELDGGGQQHGLGEGLLDLHQAARVLGPGRGDAARPAELDARGDLVPARGEQRRGQGVAGVAGVGLPVEGELDGGGAVDAAALGRCGRCWSSGSPAWGHRGGRRPRSGRWRCRGSR